MDGFDSMLGWIVAAAGAVAAYGAKVRSTYQELRTLILVEYGPDAMDDAKIRWRTRARALAWPLIKKV